MDKKLLSATFLVFSLTLFATSTLAANLYVDDDGQADGTSCDSVTAAYSTIQSAINAAIPGDTIYVCPGTYVEGPQIVINKNLNIVGENKNTVIIKPSANTGNSGDSRGWFLVNAGKVFNLEKVTLDGSGKNIFQAVRFIGSGSVSNCVIKNIKYSTYLGMGIAAMGDGDTDVINCDFSNIERLGIIYFGTGITTNSEARGNTYVGKGVGDWIDYGIEVGGGAKAVIVNNSISNCRGVASSDGSTSAAILVTTYYGAGTQATITDNTMSNCYMAIAVGYNPSDTSIVTANNNNFLGNEYGISSTNPSVDGKRNWWGSNTGPGTIGPGSGAKVSSNVVYDPWACEKNPTTWFSQNGYCAFYVPSSTPILMIVLLVSLAAIGVFAVKRIKL